MSRVTPLLCPLLVGRDDLLELADRRLVDAAEGHGQILLLTGEAGIGKSRLLASVVRKARDRGMRTADGALAPQDLTVPGAVVLDLARTMRATSGMERLGTDLLDILGSGDDVEPRTRRLLVMSVVDLLCDGLGEPVLLALEDLQWADQLSLEIVSEFARRIRERPILVVGAYRTDEGSTGRMREWRARLMTQRLAEEARLAPLTRDQTGLMTTLILSTGLPAPREVVDAVFERTDGIPLHIEELLGALGDEARADGRAIRETGVPATIEDAVLARFGRLSPEARAVAQAGAVIGRCFVPEVLAGVMDLPIAALDAPLMELVDHSFLEMPGPRGLYDYRHQLLRDALYRSVPTVARRRFHARAGEFGAQLEGASEIHASAHFERAGLRAEAFHAALSGARTAARLSAHGEACELYRRAVDNLPSTLDPAEQGALFEAYATEAAAMELLDDAESATRRAREQYLRAGDPVGAAMQIGMLTALARRGARPIQDRVDLIAQGLAELEPLPASVLREAARSDLLAEEAIVRLDVMDLRGAREVANLALEAALAADDRARPFYIDIIRATIDALEGDVDTGLSRISAVARVARDNKDEVAAVMGYRNVVSTAIRMLRYDTAEASLGDGLLYADAIEQAHCRQEIGAAQAFLNWTGGRWDAARSGGEQELANRGCARVAIGAEVALGCVALGRGDFDRARTLLRAALAAGERSGVIELVLPAAWGLAETDLLAGDPASTARRCAGALDLASSVGERPLLVPFAVTGVRANLALDRPEVAARWAADVEAYLAGSSQTAATTPAISGMTGLVRLTAGSTGLAREAFEEAIAGWDELGRIWEATWARLDLTGCHLRSNRFAEAAALLATVRETASALESEPLLARVEELARVTHRGRGAMDEPWRPLTSREFEVARLISEGMTNAEIADALTISPKTASAHVEHILAKLGVARRTEIAAWVASISRSAVTSSR